jgi:hypothetical protein
MLWQTLHHFNIHLYMAYPSIASPRERDQVLMEIFHSLDLSQETMLSLSWCRVSLETIFLLDITTTDGRYLEDFVFNPGGRDRSSSFKFPCKVPTREDWNRWFDFWHSFMTTGDKLKDPLGNWINPTHRIWKWFYREDSNDLLRVEGKTMFHYKPAAGFRLTRSTGTYHMSYEEPFIPAMDHGLPILFTSLSVQQVTKLSIGPALLTETDACTGFWEFLHSWGGTWMWEVIKPGKDTPEDVSWIVYGLHNGSLIWTTDGSYDQKKAVNLCGVGWIIFCTNTGFQLTGTFWEQSPLPSLYRAELLGLCALHLFAQALAEFYKVVRWTAKLCCINKPCWRCLLTTRAASDQVQNAPTYATVSRRSNHY